MYMWIRPEKKNPDKMVFNEIWSKAKAWLNDDEFHAWLCYCYGAMSGVADADDRKILTEAINGKIYDMIAARGLKKKKY